jgi:hypothetical protein
MAPAISSPRFSFAINYCSDFAPFSWEYLTVFTTSPNEWRKKRACMGMNGVQKAPPESNEGGGTASQNPESSRHDMRS